MDGRGARAMLYNRIGFCVLHPWRELGGAGYRGETPQGPVTGEFPRLVAPQRFENGVYVPLFNSVSRLEIALAGGGEVTLAFDGDLFETEDQRNWTDSSFKTYCTPLALGFPHQLAAGERRHQAVTVSARAVAPARRRDRWRDAAAREHRRARRRGARVRRRPRFAREPARSLRGGGGPAAGPGSGARPPRASSPGRLAGLAGRRHRRRLGARGPARARSVRAAAAGRVLRRARRGGHRAARRGARPRARGDRRRPDDHAR